MKLLLDALLDELGLISVGTGATVRRIGVRDSCLEGLVEFC